MKSYSERLNTLIPGGCHTYSRGDDQFPVNAPQILKRGKGSTVWDPDGNSFLDYGMGLRSVSIGYSDDRVNRAAIAEIENGNNLTRASLTELKAAEKLLSIVEGADMVKFAKNGSNVTTAAVKLARAYTGKKYIARCSQHPFFSFDDWFIGNTVIKKGVPSEVQSLTLKFEYNNRESVSRMFRENKDIAAIILEPASIESPCSNLNCPEDCKYLSCKDLESCSQDNFLKFLRKKCDENKCLLILDEMVTGFRWSLQGAQKMYGVVPDLSTFGKGMANGFSLAALVGKEEIMSIGGIKNSGAERTFLLSTTHGAEMSPLGAFLETVKIYEEENVIDHMWKFGSTLKKEMNSLSMSLGLERFFYIDGFDCSPYFVTNNINGESCMTMRTIFCQEMIRNGVLMPWIAISKSHGQEELEKTLDASRSSLLIFKEALDQPERFLESSHILKPVFRRYN